MTPDALPMNSENAADRRADRRALILLGVMTIISLCISASTKQIDLNQAGVRFSPLEPWVSEGTSHLAIFFLALIGAPWILDRAPFVKENWVQSVSIHLAAIAGFSVIHVGAMYAMRVAIFPAVVGYPYRVNLFEPVRFFYELSKDVFTYATVMFVFFAFRAIEQKRLEAQVVRATARDSGLLTLKSGGSRFVVKSSDIIWAKAAGNYVDVKSAEKTFLARMTLAKLEALLSDAGSEHARVHRSYIVHLGHIRKSEPTGEGSLALVMSDGEPILASRGYRKNLDGKFAQE